MSGAPAPDIQLVSGGRAVINDAALTARLRHAAEAGHDANTRPLAEVSDSDAAEHRDFVSFFAELEAQLGDELLLVTQNVDGLHQAAGSRNVVDLHGRIDTVRCLACHTRVPRDAFQEELTRRNPGFASLDALSAPDGDADLEGIAFDQFDVPACASCGGLMKPDVVFLLTRGIKRKGTPWGPSEAATMAFSCHRSRRSGSFCARMRARAASGTSMPRTRSTVSRLRAASSARPSSRPCSTHRFANSLSYS